MFWQGSQGALTIAVWKWMRMCGGVVSRTACAPHVPPLWCEMVIPTLSQTTIRELCFLFKTRAKMTQHNHCLL